MYTLIRMAPAGSIHHTVSTCPPDNHVSSTCLPVVLGKCAYVAILSCLCNTVNSQLGAAVLHEEHLCGRQAHLAGDSAEADRSQVADDVVAVVLRQRQHRV